MNIQLESIGFYQNNKDFWNENKEQSRFFEKKFGHKFNAKNDDESNELIIEYFELKDGLFHIEFNEAAYSFEVYELQSGSITIQVSGGVVQDVLKIGNNTKVIVKDYDTDTIELTNKNEIKEGCIILEF